MDLAHPQNPIGLREQIVSLYGTDNAVELWMDAKFDNSRNQFIWQDDNTVVPGDSSLWYTDGITTHPTLQNGACLLLLSWELRQTEQPDKPYFSQYCSSGYHYVLCGNEHN